ncbi:MAG: hypothetical protein GKR95_07590 [Gammaproteobacteria bacterium]|nr:hypothetical protein [Gammaproteobacteria bacterium]
MQKQSNKSVFLAISKAINTTSTILSPLIFVSVISDVFNAVEFIGKYYLSSLILLSFLFIIFSYHLVSIVRQKSFFPIRHTKESLEVIPEKTPVEYSKNSKRRWGKRFIWGSIGTGILISTLIYVVYIFNLAAQGLYYPIISSLPKENIKARISNINMEIKEKGYTDFNVNFYCRSDQEFCALVPNGIHFSKISAKQSIEIAKKIIPENVSHDHKVISHTLKDTIMRKIKKIPEKLSF